MARRGEGPGLGPFGGRLLPPRFALGYVESGPLREAVINGPDAKPSFYSQRDELR